MFITITQKKKSLCAKVPTRLFPIMGAKGSPIYASDHLSKNNNVTLDLMLVTLSITDVLKARFVNPHNRVRTLLESTEGKATFTYNDLTYLMKVSVSFKNVEFIEVLTHSGRYLDVIFPKFKITKREDGNFTIM